MRLEIRVNFVRAITLDTGQVRAEGGMVHRGRPVVTPEGKSVAADGARLLAHASTTCLVMRSAPSRAVAARLGGPEA